MTKNDQLVALSELLSLFSFEDLWLLGRELTRPSGSAGLKWVETYNVKDKRTSRVRLVHYPDLSLRTLHRLVYRVRAQQLEELCEVRGSRTDRPLRLGGDLRAEMEHAVRTSKSPFPYTAPRLIGYGPGLEITSQLVKKIAYSAQDASEQWNYSSDLLAEIAGLEAMRPPAEKAVLKNLARLPGLNRRFGSDCFPESVVAASVRPAEIRVPGVSGKDSKPMTLAVILKLSDSRQPGANKYLFRSFVFVPGYIETLLSFFYKSSDPRKAWRYPKKLVRELFKSTRGTEASEVVLPGDVISVQEEELSDPYDVLFKAEEHEMRLPEEMAVSLMAEALANPGFDGTARDNPPRMIRYRTPEGEKLIYSVATKIAGQRVVLVLEHYKTDVPSLLTNAKNEWDVLLFVGATRKIKKMIRGQAHWADRHDTRLTGKSGLSPLLWARKQIDIFQWLHPEAIISVVGTDDKRNRAYMALTRYGFKKVHPDSGWLERPSLRELPLEVKRKMARPPIRGHRATRNPMKQGWETVMPLEDVLAFVPLMEDYDVSEVARSERGFLTAFKKAGGDLSRMGNDPKFGQHWPSRRENFIARHMGQVASKGESLWSGSDPSRRHLALIAWAYTPDPEGVSRWLERRRRK